tara:strand:+ start:2344 stop:3264 length:921 start_codon:yes stop_codon:yes gene_type:complete
MKKKLLIIFFLLFFSQELFSQTNNSVIITVGNYPITRLDLVKEIKLLAILSKSNINENNKEEIKNLAIQTLVKRAIKKNEIERLKITQYNSADLDRQVSKIAKNLGLNKDSLIVFLKQKNLKYEDVIKNFEIDLKWNTAIFKLYKNKISLNTIEIENKINLEIENLKAEKSVLLSEIQVNLSNEGLESTAKNIYSEIEEVGFENAARKLSISNTANKGGNIGWLKEDKFTEKIYKNIKNLKKGEVSKPILIDGVVIIIRKDDERTSTADLEDIKKKIVNQEKMKKLDMFSNSHYSDLEKKIKVKFL